MDVPNTPASAFHPVTIEHWDDLASLFGPRRACAGCWCMWWQVRQSEFDRQKGKGNRLASTFRTAGFVEVARRSPKRPVTRTHSKIGEAE
jgi:hypothetical protein